ncbi:unnamed protein product [Nesidiocoris tenuis]|uniref:DUF4794 domain-containing protein n=1 Tax=Nesidiocoris tenuis TaxID=355587 RepID=A0A6H5HT76_9HEMI|nr:unnamed protein product [Nesidiocoris tenuis]
MNEFSLCLQVLTAFLAYAMAAPADPTPTPQEQESVKEEDRVKKDVLLGTLPYAYVPSAYAALPSTYAALPSPYAALPSASYAYVYDDVKYYPSRYVAPAVVPPVYPDDDFLHENVFWPIPAQSLTFWSLHRRHALRKRSSFTRKTFFFFAPGAVHRVSVKWQFSNFGHQYCCSSSWPWPSHVFLLLKNASKSKSLWVPRRMLTQLTRMPTQQPPSQLLTRMRLTVAFLATTTDFPLPRISANICSTKDFPLFAPVNETRNVNK